MQGETPCLNASRIADPTEKYGHFLRLCRPDDDGSNHTLGIVPRTAPSHNKAVQTEKLGLGQPVAMVVNWR